jgi:hopene-associated glycosyltransferase HpnB
MTLYLAATGALAVWLYLLLARGRFWLEFARPPQHEPRAMAASPPVVAIIPARDEAAVVARAIASLAAQQYSGPFHIVLVDDHSTDGTAAAARAAAPASLLTVIDAAPLPPGWTGKLWAVEEGIRHAAAFDPEFYLLTDADIVHPSDNLRTLTAHAGCDLVSYMATLECRTLAERALVPAFVFFFFMLYPPAWIRDPRRSTAGAAGGCMLVRRAALERAGGIAAIRGELIDDCALARAIKRGGGRVWLGLGAETRSIRPYAGFGEIGGMISRTAFTQLRRSGALLAAVAAAMLWIFLLPPLALAFAPVPSAAAWLAMSVAYWPALRFYRRSWLWTPLVPLVAAFYMGATIHSAVSYWRGRGGQWKGRAQAAGASGRLC